MATPTGLEAVKAPSSIFLLLRLKCSTSASYFVRRTNLKSKLDEIKRNLSVQICARFAALFLCFIADRENPLNLVDCQRDNYHIYQQLRSTFYVLNLVSPVETLKYSIPNN